MTNPHHNVSSVEVFPYYTETHIEVGFFSGDKINIRGVVFVQDHVPTSAQEHDNWYNPLTLQYKVFTNGAWAPVSPDGGYF